MELTKQNLIINFVDFQFPCGSKLIKFCHVRFIWLFLCLFDGKWDASGSKRMIY